MSILKGGVLKKPDASKIQLDGNIDSYDVSRDGRASGARQWVRLDQVVPSPFQVRRVFPQEKIAELAKSIRENGLIHEPKGRPLSGRPGWVELLPGEMRLRALRWLAETEDPGEVLKKDAEGHWLVPIQVESIPDDRAAAIVFSENADRADLSDWEWALAWQQQRKRLQQGGRSSSVRDLASIADGLPGKSVVSEYLRIADAVTVALLREAGVVTAEREPDHDRLRVLSRAALLRVASAVEQGRGDAAEQLLVELDRAKDKTARGALADRRAAASRSSAAAKTVGFQINIRQALHEVPPKQATRYLERLVPTVEQLVRQAEMSPSEVKALREGLERTLAQLDRAE